MNDVVTLRMPLAENDVSALHTGQNVRICGTVITARDAAHRYLLEREDADGLPFDLAGGVLYHCGPIIKTVRGRREVVSAGPTTSIRMEMYEPGVIERYALRAIIGKGGMGPQTAHALSSAGAVYLAAPSGAGALLAKRMVKVSGVWKLEEFGSPEALWQIEVVDFPAIVAMDMHGGNLYDEVEKASAEALARLVGSPFEE